MPINSFPFFVLSQISTDPTSASWAIHDAPYNAKAVAGPLTWVLMQPVASKRFDASVRTMVTSLGTS